MFWLSRGCAMNRLEMMLLVSVVPLCVWGTQYTWNDASSPGNWSSNANWSPSTGHPSSSADTAVFGNFAGTVTVDTAGLAADSLTFDSTHNFTINNSGGFSLSLGGGVSAQNIVVPSGATTNTISTPLIFSGPIVISQGSSSPLTISGGVAAATTNTLTQQGTGTVIFSGTYNYTGATTVTSGTMQAGAASSFAAASSYTINSPGILSLNNFANTIASLNGSGSVVTGGSSGILTVTNGGTFSGGITGSGGLTLTGGILGLSTLTSANTYSGATSISGGATLRAGQANAFSSSSAHTVTGTLDLNNNANAIASLSGAGSVLTGGSSGILTVTNGGTFSGGITGSGGVTLTTGGTLQLTTTSSANTYSGPTSIGASTTLKGGGAANSFSSSSDHTVTGTIDLFGFSNAIRSLAGAGGVTSTAAGTATLSISNGSNGGSFAGAITGSSSDIMALNLTGGTLILTGVSNTYFGATTILGPATLEAGATNAFSPNSAVTVTGVLDLHGFANTIASLSGAGSVKTGGTSGILTISNGGTFSGGIADAGGISLLGGTLQLSTTSVANTYSGATTIASGATLKAGALNAFPLNSDVTVTGPSGVLDLNGISNTIRSLSGGGSVSSSSSGTATLTVSNGGTFSGAITGSSSNILGLTLTGGTLDLTGNTNSYYGTTTVQNSATFEAGATNAFSPNSAVILQGSSILNLQTFANTIASLNGGIDTFIQTGGSSAILTVSPNGGEFAGKMTGTGGLALNGSTLTLTNENSYTGGTTITSGSLLIKGSGQLASTGAVVANGTFDISGITGIEQTVGNLNGSGTVNLGSKQLIVNFTSPSTSVFSGTIQGAGGSFTQEGSTSTLTLSNSTYNGPTNIMSGTLEAATTTAFASSSDFTVTGALNLNGHSNTIKSLSGAGSVEGGSGTPTLTITNGGSFSGTIVDSGGTLAVHLTQGGTLTLSGSNTYSGPTTIDSGTQLVAGGLGVFSPDSDATVNGTLNLANFANTVKSLSGSGSSPQGVITGGSSGILTVLNGGTFSGGITGAGGLDLSGGTLTLSTTTSANTYTGPTTVGDGVSETSLIAGSANALSPNSDVTLNVSGSLFLAASNTIKSLQGPSGSKVQSSGSSTLTITNGGSFSGQLTDLLSSSNPLSLTLSGGTLQLLTGNAATYLGPTLIESGATLFAGANNAFSSTSDYLVTGILNLNNTNNAINSLTGSGSVTTGGASGGILTLNYTSPTTSSTFSGSITGNGGVTINAGSGALTLSGTSNTYSGATTINNGTTLLAGATNAFSPNSPVTLSGTGILNLSNQNNTIFSLSSASSTSSVILGSGTLSITGSASTTFAGQIVNTPCGGLTVGASNTLTLTGTSNTYCGPTLIDGTLNINASGALSTTTAVTVASTGTLTTLASTSNTAASITSSGTITNSGNLGGTNTDSPFLITSGTVTNNASAQFGNSTTYPIGGESTAISFTGGTIVNQNLIAADTYSQSGTSTLNLYFGGASLPSTVAQVITTGNIAIGGNLIVTGAVSHPAFSGGYNLINTIGSSVLTGTFSTFTPAGTLVGASPRLSYSRQSVDLFFSGCNNTWTTANNGNWGDGTNWGGGCIPGDTGFSSDVANFVDLGQSSITVTLANPAGDAAFPIDLFQLNLNSATNAYFIQQFSTASTITFSSGSLSTPTTGVPQIQVMAGSHIIEAPLILNQLAGNDTEVVLTDGAQLTFSGNTTLTSTSAQNFLVRQSSDSTLGSGVLINNATLTPYSMSLHSATLQNNGSITTQSSVIIAADSGTNAYLYNADTSTQINPVGFLTIGGSGTTLVQNDGANAFIGTTGVASTLSIEGSGTTTIINDGVFARLGPTGVASSLNIVSSGTLLIANNGTKSFFGPSGTGGDFLVAPTGPTTINNSGPGVIMGPSGSGGNLTLTGGTIQNALGATIKAGPGGTFLINGAVVNNDLSSFVGTSTENINFTSGTLNTSGDVLAFDYTQSGSSVLQLNLTSSTPTMFGNVAASDIARVGSSLIVDALPGFSASSNTVMNVVTGEKGVFGTYSSVQLLNFPSGTIPTIFYAPNAVQLVFASTITPNPSGSLPQVSFLSVNQNNIMLGREMNSLHRKIKKKKRKYSQDVTFNMLTAEAEPLETNLTAANGWRTKRKENQLEQKVVEKSANPSRFYIGPIDSFGEVQSRGTSQRGFGFNSAGLFSGYDYAFDEWGLGLSANYSRVSATVRRSAGHFNVNLLHTSAYAVWVPEFLQALSVDAIAGWGYGWYGIHRKAGPSIATVKTKGSPNGMQADGLLGAEYIFSNDQFRAMPDHMSMTPFFDLQFIWAHVDDYNERNGGIYGLSVGSQHAQSLRSNLGMRFDYTIEKKDIIFTPELDIAWQREYLDHSRKLNFTTIAAPNFQEISQQIVGAGRNTLLIGVDFMITAFQVFELEMSYDFQLNDLYRNNSFYFGVGGNF